MPASMEGKYGLIFNTVMFRNIILLQKWNKVRGKGREGEDKTWLADLQKAKEGWIWLMSGWDLIWKSQCFKTDQESVKAFQTKRMSYFCIAFKEITSIYSESSGLLSSIFLKKNLQLFIASILNYFQKKTLETLNHANK